MIILKVPEPFPVIFWWWIETVLGVMLAFFLIASKYIIMGS